MARNSSDTINHLGSVRMRVKGIGTLKTTAYSLDFVNSSNLPDITMSTNANKLPTILSDFKEMKICLEIRTEAINEFMNFSKITPYLRPIAMEYPQ